ncbi:hypothetical protein E1301_Tti002596 [Triplophysa tibetana]|uniref:GH18 domain-containing protein n=1 Tax=Triplophysa tibetana TaxID=1572043 RepID=A0A5A9NDJ7_9TELE|nr:hypothetical protein E1301_Tti002596 [Triplophysa tibetana]
MLLNRALVFLCLVIVEGAQTEHRVTCYLDVLTPRTRPGPCTHIIVPSALTNGTFNPQSLSDYDALGKMKGRNPTLKILLGLEVEASRLELMFPSESSVENFTHTSLSYLKEKAFDGLDLTWVYGPSSESSDSSELLRNFLESLREAFEEETRSSGRTLLLSLSLSHQYDHSSAVGCDVRTLLQYVDFISLLPAQLEKDGTYINETVQHWHDQQVDLQKLNLALPAFLRRSGRRHHHHHHHHPSNNDKNTDEGKKHHIQGVGLKLANRVCLSIKSSEEFITLTSLSDEPSLDKEVSWLLQKGFGGVGAVFIDMDGFFNTVCDSISQDERAMVESKMIMHHGRRVHGLGGHHHHHGREHHHSHRDHQSHLSHRSHDISHHHHRHRHHHRHGHHGHHHHHLHPTPQYEASERRLGLE